MRIHIIATFAVCLCAASPSIAQERTAAIIHGLTGKISAGIDKFDRLTIQSLKADRLQGRSETERALAGARDPVEREKLRAQFLEDLAAQNARQRGDVESGLRTLDQIVSTIIALKQRVRRFYDKQRVHPLGLTDRFRTFATNAAIVVERLTLTTNPRIVDRLSHIEDTLVSEYELRFGELGPAQSQSQSMRDLHDAFRFLESAYVDLLQARNMLEAEQMRLETALYSTGIHRFGGAIRERIPVPPPRIVCGPLGVCRMAARRRGRGQAVVGRAEPTAHRGPRHGYAVRPVPRRDVAHYYRSSRRRAAPARPHARRPGARHGYAVVIHRRQAGGRGVPPPHAHRYYPCTGSLVITGYRRRGR